MAEGELDEASMELKITKCQLKVYEDMHDMRKTMHGVVLRVNDLEKGHKELHLKLDRHEAQRKTMHEESDKKLEQVLTLVQSIGKESSDNAKWISKVNMIRLKISFVVLGVGGTLGLLYWGYGFLSKHGVVFVIETSGVN